MELDSPPPRPTFREALAFWFKLGCISFGGPAGQVAIMHRELVEKKRWIGEERFLHALNFCMLLPGPEAQQLAIYIGWSLHGIRGGVVAGTLFVLPAALLLWALSWLYVAGGSLPWIAGVFYGLQPAVMAIVAVAVLKIGGKALKTPLHWSVATLAFLGIFVFHWPFVWLILGAAAVGVLARAAGFLRSEPETLTEPAAADPVRPGPIIRTLVGCAVLWWLPVFGFALTLGWQGVFTQLGLFFSKAALITFGGAYAVLPYVAQQAVEMHGWLAPSQMMAGIGLAETTPGPLIIVLQFVGFLAGWQHPAPFSPLVAGTLGAAITTWTTFLPSFLFILTGAPLVEKLRRLPLLTAALSTITAAVAGIILNLAVWFGLHTVHPAPGKIDFYALALAVMFFLGLWKGNWNVLTVILGGAALGLVGRLVFGF